MAKAAVAEKTEEQAGDGASGVDEFDTMFDSLADPDAAQGGDDGKDEGVDEDAEEGKEKAGDSAGDGKTKKEEGEEGTGGEGEKDGGEDAGKGDGAESEEGEQAVGSAGRGDQDTDDIRARLERLESKRASEVDGGADEKGEKAGGTGRVEEPPLYTDDEQKIVDQYLEEWGDQEKGAALVRRAEQAQLAKWMFGEMSRALKPFVQAVETLTTNEHLAGIYDAHSDYDEVYGSVVKWAKVQTGLLGKAYKEVLREGTAGEVAELVSAWKTATNYKSKGEVADGDAQGEGQEGKSGNKGAAKPTKGALDPAKLAAARKLAGAPRGRGSPVNQGADPGDFGSAFDEFAGS